MGQRYPESDVQWTMYDPADEDSYVDLDRFGRVTTSRWTKDLGTDVNLYEVDITYNRNSNITLIEDNIHTGFDVDYTNDDLDRLTKAEEGTWNGSSITSRSRQQIWDDGAGNLGLSQAGNWERVRLDMNGDNDFIDADEYDDDRTHNDVNELTGRDTDDNGTDDYTLVYDETGNLTDDGENYEYVYDAFYRLCEIRDTSDQSLVASYEYNALDYRITVLQDTDTDGDVDANDLEYHPAYDNRWRIVALYRDTDTDPKEMFIYHAAGLDGRGGSSYIDGMILRDKDANTGWTSASDGTLEQRYYYCQNWRSDVVALVTAGGYEVEWVKDSAYGTPFGLPGADTDSDGDCDATDITQIQTWIDAPAYDVRGDVDLDGDVDATDKTIAQTYYQGTTSGWNDLTAVGNRKGYAGYERNENVGLDLARNRFLHNKLGRWTRRDPLGYVDGMSLYEYVGSHPTTKSDPSGLLDIEVWPCPPDEDVPARSPECCAKNPNIGVNAPGGVVCCDGRPIVCLDRSFWDGFLGLGRRKKQVMDCMRECEPLHCPNADCTGRDEGPPAFPEKSRACSEVDVYECMIECVKKIDCGSSWNCEKDKDRIIEDLKRGLDHYKPKCQDETRNEPSPGQGSAITPCHGNECYRYL